MELPCVDGCQFRLRELRRQARGNILDGYQGNTRNQGGTHYMKIAS
jgi:hypothetical protein